eukprot:CAMPEP_0169102734 /NCGR_PEP_ID=MMETSP1015-20121227/22328_1 /TAXON_ID=342587 /ORGANISM="Karlodinium micrum, Strain CCMP2283" /LENGTH=579 /DNA_ID=CAMNT_0009163861 /DNA_START=71 /DNA_END=1807 /DNA_ORIENTATION=-
MDRLACFVLMAMPLAAFAGVRGRTSPGAAVQRAQEKLQAAGEKDGAAHDKAGCFCQTILTEKQQIVENMQQQLTSLSHDIDEQTAKIAQLDVEVKQHQQELESNSNALASAESIRQKDQEQFTDEEQLHTQSIDQLQNALAALKNPHSTDAALITIREVTSRTKGRQQLVLLQAQKGLRFGSASSPAEITGIMQRMLTSFNKNLQGMREDEIAAKTRHEGLVAAKSSEISTQKKFITEKNRRLATTKVSVNFQSQIQTRSQKVLDSNVQLLSTLKQMCQRNDESFEIRKRILQTEYTALSGAQAEIAGAQLLSVSGTSRGDGVTAICSIPPEFQEKKWRDQANAACDKAKAGLKQDAADAIEALELDVKEAQSEVSRQQDACTEEIHGAQVEASAAASRQSTEANFVDSEQKDAQEQIDAMTAQSEGAVKAKADFAQVVASQNEAFQALRVATSSGKDILNAASNSAGGKAAQGKIAEAIGESEKLMAAVDDFVAANDKDVEQLAAQFDAVQLAAGKALIPLRLMKADSEEAAIAIKEESKSSAHAMRPNCDAASLAAEVSKLNAYRSKLGKAAESLAW